MSNESTPTEQEERCQNSGVETYKYNCSGCRKFYIDAAEMIAGVDIRSIFEKIETTKEFFEDLFEKGFEVRYIPQLKEFLLL